VRIDPLFQAPDPALVQGASVTSSRARGQPGIAPARSDLIVTRSSAGAARRRAIETFGRAIVWFSPARNTGRRNTDTAMTHIAIQERLDGKVVDWMEQVSEEQYKR